jgi:uncharacterized membrane protein YhaH (DUF805 family)
LPDTSNLLNWAFNAFFGWLIPLGATIMVFALVGWLLAMLLFIVPTWRICSRAGFPGALSLLHIIPVIGTLVLMAILAFSDWPKGEARR